MGYTDIDTILERAYAYDRVRNEVDKYVKDHTSWFDKILGREKSYRVDATLFLERAIIYDANKDLASYLSERSIPFEYSGDDLIVELDNIQGKGAIYSDTKRLEDIASVVKHYTEGLKDFSPDIPYRQVIIEYDDKDTLNLVARDLEKKGYTVQRDSATLATVSLVEK